MNELLPVIVTVGVYLLAFFGWGVISHRHHRPKRHERISRKRKKMRKAGEAAHSAILEMTMHKAHATERARVAWATQYEQLAGHAWWAEKPNGNPKDESELEPKPEPEPQKVEQVVHRRPGGETITIVYPSGRTFRSLK